MCVSPQASDLDGEIDLATCSNVTEYQAQRNYGFQIQVWDVFLWLKAHVLKSVYAKRLVHVDIILVIKSQRF